MGTEAGELRPGRELLRSFLVLWLLLPLLAQGLLVLGVMLVGSAGFRNGAVTIAGVLAVWLAAGIAGALTRRGPPPSSWAWRYGPVFACLATAWLLWAVDMHLSGGDFTRRGLPHATLFAILPWFPLAFVTALGGDRWMLLALPTLAYASYAVVLWWRSRGRALASTQWRAPACLLLAGLAGVIGWQALDRERKLVPDLRASAVSEELDLWKYKPFAPGNRLVRAEFPGAPMAPAEAPRLDGATAGYPLYAALAQAAYTREAAERNVAVSRTPTAYDRLIRGEVDAIFVAQPSPEHERRAREQGVELQLTPIAREAFVFLVHESNPVRGLSVAQVRDIYAGRIQRWEQVGGAGGAIVPFQRPRNSGSQTVMEAKVMRGETLRKPLEEEVARGMGGLVRRVAVYRNAPQALGYSFRYYATQMEQPQSVRLLAIDGVAPTRDKVRSGAYPFTVDVFLVTTDRSRPATQRLREWLLGVAGQKLVEDVGYVGR